MNSSSNALRPSKGQRSCSNSMPPQNEGSEAEDSTPEDNHSKDGDDDGSEGSGGVSECDERNGEERKFAEQSPTKGKQRLNSKACILHQLCSSQLINKFQALVKVENSDKHELKSQARFTNKDLPPLLAPGDIWTKKVIPTLFRWLAAQKDPWAPSALHLEGAIRLLCRHYVDEEYDLDGPRSPEFQLVCFIFYIESYC